MLTKEIPKCGYCNAPTGYRKNPNYKVEKPKKFCSPLCSSRHRRGWTHDKVVKSKIPEKVLLDPEDRQRALDMVMDDLRKKWKYSYDGAGDIITTVIDLNKDVVHKKWKGKEWTQHGRKQIYLHKFVMGAQGSDIVLHLNGDKNDCRKSNLKVMTREEYNTYHNTKKTEEVLTKNGLKKKMVFNTIHGVKEVFFNLEDWDALKGFAWSIKHGRKSRYTDYVQARIDHPDGSIVTKFRRANREGPYQAKRTTMVTMHRVIMGLGQIIDGAGEDVVDHRDGNGLNNCRENLRVCSPTENSRNLRGARKNSAVPYKGVKLKPRLYKLIKQGVDISQIEIKNPYTAQINYNKKRIHLGCFATAEDAARAYDTKSKELFGEFAKLNFPK